MVKQFRFYSMFIYFSFFCGILAAFLMHYWDKSKDPILGIFFLVTALPFTISYLTLLSKIIEKHRWILICFIGLVIWPLVFSILLALGPFGYFFYYDGLPRIKKCISNV